MSLFDEFRTSGEAAIMRWISECLPEDDFTEFKTGAIFEKAGLTRSGKQQIGAEIAGMANAGGGVLFVGIATKQVDSLDVATNAVPIEEVDRALSHLKGQINNLVQPPVPEIEFELARVAGDSSKGFIAIRVKRSDRRPHMCRAPDLHTYFKRSGTSTMPMGPYEVEDQVLRFKNAELTAYIEFKDSGSFEQVRTFDGMILLCNISDVSAANAWVGVDSKAMEFLSDGQKNLGFRVGPRVPSGRTFFAESHLLIPPESEALVCGFQLKLAKVAPGQIDERIEVRDSALHHKKASERPMLRVQFGCLNTKPKVIERVLTEEDIDDLFDSGKLVIT